MIKEDKISLTHRRAELVTVLAGPLPPEDRVRIQGELSVINAKIKALNTTQHAQLKALANQRKAAGLAEAQANATRAQTRAQGLLQTRSEENDDDPGQTSAIDAWIDAVLLRHDIEFTRSSTGKITFGCSPDWAPVLEILFAGIAALARGQELPELPSAAPRAKKTAKPKKR